MASKVLLSNLRAVFDVERDDQVPPGALERCERVESLIQRMKPEGALASTQVLAVVLEQYERDQGARAQSPQTP